jgi:PAS domain-containing protein
MGGTILGRQVKKRSKRANKKRSPSTSVRQRRKKKSSAARSHPGHVSERELIRAKEALERKTAELALSLSMMQATLDSTTDAIIVTDINGNVRDFNEKYAEMMGVTRAHLNKADVNAGGERGRLFMPHMNPTNFFLPAKRLGNGVERVSRNSVNSFHPR